MQLLMNASRYLLLLVLSCSFLMVWKYGSLIESNDNNTEITGLNAETIATSIFKPISSSVQIINQPIDIAITKPIIKPIAAPIAATTSTPKLVDVKPVATVWNSIARELKLDHKVQTSQVKTEIRRLLADKGEFNRILNSATPYIYFIFKQTQERGLPAELALIPFVESQFNPYDRSNKGAIGLWQLMPGTARELGVKIKSGYDGRRNVIASTKAALIYFRDLGKNFKGDWYLAMAAYNCGQVKVESAVRRAGHRNFWDLSLPRDTKYYVPRLLAVAEIIKNPQKYGVKLPAILNSPYFTEMKVEKSLNLSEIAQSSGISVKILQTLNPDYKQGLVPKAYSLLIPVKKSAATSQML